MRPHEIRYGANLVDSIARLDNSFQQFRLNTTAFSVIGDVLPNINIIDIYEKILVTSRHDDDAVVRIDFYGNIPFPPQGNATTVSVESY